MTHEILANKFQLQPLKEILTLSRRKNQHYNEYPELIKLVNETDNICVKICINDFIDLKSCVVKDEYKSIDYNKFDHIVFVKRDNIIDTVLSYGYQDQHDPSKWHRRRGTDIVPTKFVIDINRVYYILRAYRLYQSIEEYICSHNTHSKIHHYEFNSIEQGLKKDFDIADHELITSTDSNNIDYSSWAINYQDTVTQFNQIKKQILSATDADIADKNSFFWKNQVDYI